MDCVGYIGKCISWSLGSGVFLGRCSLWSTFFDCLRESPPGVVELKAFLNLAIMANLVNQRLVASEYADPSIDERCAEGRRTGSRKTRPETGGAANVEDWGFWTASVCVIIKGVRNKVKSRDHS